MELEELIQEIMESEECDFLSALLRAVTFIVMEYADTVAAWEGQGRPQGR